MASLNVYCGYMLSLCLISVFAKCVQALSASVCRRYRLEKDRERYSLLAKHEYGSRQSGREGRQKKDSLSVNRTENRETLQVISLCLCLSCLYVLPVCVRVYVCVCECVCGFFFFFFLFYY